MNQKVKNFWEVYIIKTECGKLYTGITNNMEKRFSNHLTKKGGARFFHFSAPEKIVYREQLPDRSTALKREAAIKKMDRQQKLALCQEILLTGMGKFKPNDRQN